MGIEEVVKAVEYRVNDKLTLGKLNEIVNDAIVNGAIPRNATVSVSQILDSVVTFRWIDQGKAKDYKISYKESKYGSFKQPYKDEYLNQPLGKWMNGKK